MKTPSRRGLHALTMTGGLIFLAGCNTEPNANFEKALQEQSAKQQKADPSAALFRVLPSQDRYLQFNPDVRSVRTQQLAVDLRARLELALKAFDTGLKVQGVDALLATCRRAFGLAIGLQVSQNSSPQAARDRVADAVLQLTACREQSIAAEKKHSGERAEAAGALKRFASASLVLVGLVTTGHGDEPTGLDLWGQGYLLAAEDQPGFKLSWRTFFGK